MAGAVVGKRSFGAVVAEGPRMTIAKNMLAFHRISAAKSEAELTAASSESVKIDVAALQPELAGMEGYLTAGPVAGTAAFVKDPTAWQNMEFSAFVTTEAGRADTWPFLVGGLVTFLLLGVGIPMGLTKEGRKNSKYMSMIEGRHGDLAPAEAHHH